MTSPCESCRRTDRNWQDSGQWSKCEECLKEFCGKCIGDRHVIYDGPSDGDFCKDCYDKIKIDDGKTNQCILCKKLMSQKTEDVFSCCWCDKYYCEECFLETFRSSPTAEDEDICEKCWVEWKK